MFLLIDHTTSKIGRSRPNEHAQRLLKRFPIGGPDEIYDLINYFQLDVTTEILFRRVG